MVTILSNINALAASRQLGITKIGLNTTITRLTTGRRVNTASDDADSLTKGNTAQAAARKAGAEVYAAQAAYFTALNTDGANQEATQAAYKMAEMEGGGNDTSAEYTALGVIAGGATSTLALAVIETDQATNAKTMTDNLSKANKSGIEAETQQGIADAYLGADMGAEMANLSKFQIMMQAGTSALNNANQSTQTILGLFR